jgi:hypothetical protein
VSTQSIYRPAPDVRHAVEATSIRLLDRKTGAVHLLAYPEAAVWDMAARGYEMNGIVDSLRHIACVPATVAEKMVVDLFKLLHERGFVTRVQADD